MTDRNHHSDISNAIASALPATVFIGIVSGFIGGAFAVWLLS